MTRIRCLRCGNQRDTRLCYPDRTPGSGRRTICRDCAQRATNDRLTHLLITVLAPEKDAARKGHHDDTN